MNSPLPIPAGFDLDAAMMRDITGEFHAIHTSAAFAEELIINGAPEDLALAVRILEATLALQERREGARNYGNFLWHKEDSAIRDLNAVEFVLCVFNALMVRYPDRIPAPLGQRILESIRAGLIESRRKDVAVTYTNIAAMDCANSLMGGELLEDEATARRGYEKLARLAEVTAANGSVYEYLAPRYMRVIMDALGRIIANVKHEPARILARAMAARYSLGIALHLHPAIGKLSGPWSRAYYGDITTPRGADEAIVRGWIKDGAAPPWLNRVLERRMPLPMQIEEGAFIRWNMGTTAYLDENFALGVASREISRQTSAFVVLHPERETGAPCVIFSRYLLNDPYYEEEATAAAHNVYTRLTDDGMHWGVMSGTKAILVSAPRIIAHQHSAAPAARDPWHSMKLAVIWLQRKTVDEIWAGGKRVTGLPAQIPEGETVVVASGPILTAIRPLRRTELGYGSPLRLRESNGALLLELYNYLGGPKVHNDLERMSRFYQGQPQCGFYAEVANRNRYPDPRVFCAEAARGTLRDEAAPPFTAYADDAERPWIIEYTRDGDTLGMEIDLINWKLRRRWTNRGDLGWPLLESPVARQNTAGRVEVEGAVFECPAAPAWLYADSDGDLFVAGYHGAPGTVTLTTPRQRLSVEEMGAGIVVCDHGLVHVDALGHPRVRPSG